MKTRQDIAAREWVKYLACLLGLWGLLLGVYALTGSFHAEFSGADEAAYVVSGVMVREYFSGALWRGESPVLFAQQYYAHYPKVAIGHWPPLYFLVEGAWLTITGVSRAAILSLSALTSAAFALITVFLCRRGGLRWTMAVVAGVVVALLPISLESLLEIGSDVFTGITILVAAWCCQRWIETPSTRSGVLLGLSMAVAILCKGTAFALLLLVPLTLIITRKPGSWWWSPRTWMPNVLAVVLVLPWYYFADELLRSGVVPGPLQALANEVAPLSDEGGLTLIWYAVRGNSKVLVNLGGIGISLLAILSIRTAWHRRWPAFAMLPLGTGIFLSALSPHVSGRLMLHLLPVLVFAAAIAARELAPRMQELVLVLALFVANPSVLVRQKASDGFVPAVAWLMRHPGVETGRILVSSNATGEGALISEFALHQPAPTRTIVRASKVLQSSTWMGENLRLLANSAADVRDILDNNQVSLVVVHETATFPPSHYKAHLEGALVGWKRVQTFGDVSIYQRGVAGALSDTDGRTPE